jgi:riboflavin synthase
MFTGLVRHRATVRSSDLTGRAGSLLLSLGRPDGWHDLRLGDSIAVHGCCLTLIDCTETVMVFEAGSETLERTLFKNMELGARLHVEQALRVGDRMDGHMVTGHVDGVAHVADLAEVAGGRRIDFDVPEHLSAMLPEKGSVCIDGISLTIAADRPGGFVVELIPETLEATELSALSIGEAVHVEVDPLARYAAHWLQRTGAFGTEGT